ncbi:hypothetical protein D9758_015950 [Tetrapyrgos nigripes]|uniref:Uncharacterized protein n=1 Tax=Tetrapyrgos nigripes TaxID=182062 RepID=A0A8H5C9G6_9AGAR|nr:hypothetical protein D9758_015950 [Tetrapyrgos nigripes]
MCAISADLAWFLVASKLNSHTPIRFDPRFVDNILSKALEQSKSIKSTLSGNLIIVAPFLAKQASATMSIRRNLFKRHLNSSGPGNMYTPEPIRQPGLHPSKVVS